LILKIKIIKPRNNRVTANTLSSRKDLKYFNPAMKKLSITLSSLAFMLAGTNPAKADWDFWAIKTESAPAESGRDYDTSKFGSKVYTFNSLTGEATFRGTKCFGAFFDQPKNMWMCQNPASTSVNQDGKLEVGHGDSNYIFDINSGNFSNSGARWQAAYTDTLGRPIAVTEKDGSKRIAISGTKLIEAKANGELHIGENSWITIEDDGVQKVYAKDANGKAIPINYSEGTDLQINGVSVQGQINSNKAGVKTNASAIKTNVDDIRNNKRSIESLEDNVNDLGFGVAGATALSTAMSALPTVAQDSPLSCGVGTGGYSSRFAMSVGCAVKANDRLSINAGGSYVFGGAADYGNGSLSTAAARAGFVFKFGNLDTPAASNEQLQSQLDKVQEENSSIREENASIRDENASIKEQNQELLARLERLEAIALGNQLASKTVSLK